MLLPVTPRFGGYYRINLTTPGEDRITDKAVLESVCTHLNNTPDTDYPMAALKQGRLGITRWRAVVVQGAMQGKEDKDAFIGMIADDRNRREEQAQAAEREVDRDLAKLMAADDFESALQGPRRLEDLSEVDRLEIIASEIERLEDASPQEAMQNAMRMLPRVPDDYFRSHLEAEARHAGHTLPQDEEENQIVVMQNDLEAANAEFDAQQDVQSDEYNTGFDRFIAEKLAAKPYLRPIDMAWKGVGNNPFGNGTPIGSVSF